ncbi:hypothetical protein EC253486_5521, partial [Escherichia coli 2534-86]
MVFYPHSLKMDDNFSDAALSRTPAVAPVAHA